MWSISSCLQAEDRQFGLVVDGINDTQEIVVKPLGKQLKGLELLCRRDHHGRWPGGAHPGRAGDRRSCPAWHGFARESAAAGDQRAGPYRRRPPDLPALPGGIVRPPGGAAVAGGAAGGDLPGEDRACRRQARRAVPRAHSALGVPGIDTRSGSAGQRGFAGSRAGGGV